MTTQRHLGKRELGQCIGGVRGVEGHPVAALLANQQIVEFGDVDRNRERAGERTVARRGDRQSGPVGAQRGVSGPDTNFVVLAGTPLGSAATTGPTTIWPADLTKDSLSSYFPELG